MTFPKYVVVTTGGRDFDDRNLIGRTVLSFPLGTLVIHGGARGADSVVRSACKVHHYPQMEMPYFGWLGKSGGHERNQQMLEVAMALQRAGALVKVVAFPGGAGTAHCVRTARRMGLPVQEVSA